MIRPFCRTCHIAFEDNNVPGTNAPAPGWDITFASPQSYETSAATAASFVCQRFLMLHVRVTSELFWQSNARMIVANEGGLPTDCTVPVG